MIKKWNQFNESKAEKPGQGISGSAKINLSDEEMNYFADEPSLEKLVMDDKVAVLGNEAWYWEDDVETRNVLDQYLELTGKVEESVVNEGQIKSLFMDIKSTLDEMCDGCSSGEDVDTEAYATRIFNLLSNR